MCVHEDGKHIICPTCQEVTRISSEKGLDGIQKNTLIEETLTYWLKQREIEQKQVRLIIASVIRISFIKITMVLNWNYSNTFSLKVLLLIEYVT